VELRLSREAEIRVGSVKAGPVEVQALDIDVDYAPPLLPWRGAVGEDQAPEEPAFTKHRPVIVHSRSVWIDLPFIGCKVVVGWEPTSETLPPHVATSGPQARKTATVIRSKWVRPLTLKSWPQSSTVHFMIAWAAMDTADVDGVLHLQARADILNVLTSKARMETRATDDPWTIELVRNKLKVARENWDRANARSFDEFAVKMEIPAATLDGVYANALEAASEYLATHAD